MMCKSLCKNKSRYLGTHLCFAIQTTYLPLRSSRHFLLVLILVSSIFFLHELQISQTSCLRETRLKFAINSGPNLVQSLPKETENLKWFSQLIRISLISTNADFLIARKTRWKCQKLSFRNCAKITKKK